MTRPATRATPLVLGLLSAATIGLWWALVPHVLAVLALWTRVGGDGPADGTPRRLQAAAVVAVAVIILALANDVATFRGGAFLPRWE